MYRSTITMAAVLALTACGKGETGQQAAADTTRGEPMENMPGMQATPMRSPGLTARMRAHLDSLAGASAPAAVARGLSVHEAMASEILDAMGADMAMMGMRPDSVWTALTDSVRRDLAELPALSGTALDTRVRAHVGRFRRLLAMHDTMMAGLSGHAPR